MSAGAKFGVVVIVFLGLGCIFVVFTYCFRRRSQRLKKMVAHQGEESNVDSLFRENTQDAEYRVDDDNKHVDSSPTVDENSLQHDTSEVGANGSNNESYEEEGEGKMQSVDIV